MKKLLAVIMALGIFSCAAFAQEKWSDNVRVEADLSIGIFTNAFELKGAYMFPISKNFSWDAGLEVDFVSNSLLSGGVNVVYESQVGYKKSFEGTSINPFASIWFKELYLKYGLGLGITEGGVAFNPYDIRIGWQPNFTKDSKRWIFKLEIGLRSVAQYSEWTNDEGERVKNISTSPDFILALGATYKF